MNTSIYWSFDSYCYIILYWLFAFTVYTFAKIVYKQWYFSQKNNTQLISHKENLILEELPGLSFILLHTVCWWLGTDLLTKVCFFYWGPLYLVTAYLVVFKWKINWKRIALPSSIACKGFYVFFVCVFLSLQLYLPIYCYSVWIMHDQVKLAWFKNNGDRTRRFFEDWFVFRLGYPLFLLLPFFIDDFYLGNISKWISVCLLFFWVTGICRLVVNGQFFVKPKIEGFGRDIVYL